jgi:hypothetical protein
MNQKLCTVLQNTAGTAAALHICLVSRTPWRATRRHLLLLYDFNSVELVPNTFNPNPGFPKISRLTPGHRQAVIDSITLVFGRPPFLSRKGGGGVSGSTLAVHLN